MCVLQQRTTASTKSIQGRAATRFAGRSQQIARFRYATFGWNRSESRQHGMRWYHPYTRATSGLSVAFRTKSTSSGNISFSLSFNHRVFRSTLNYIAFFDDLNCRYVEPGIFGKLWKTCFYKILICATRNNWYWMELSSYNEYYGFGTKILPMLSDLDRDCC